MRMVLFVIVAVTYLNAATGQNTTAVDNTTAFDPTTEMDTTTFEPTTEMGSGDDSTTTTTTILTNSTDLTAPNPCKAEGNCGSNEKCPEYCDCKKVIDALSLNGYCSEPCDYNYVWCTGVGECSPNSEVDDRYTCDCGINEYRADDGSCGNGKYFGGKIIFTIDKEKANETVIEEILNYMYKDTDLFIKSEVLNMTSGSTVVDYQLIYEQDSDVTSDSIESAYNTTTTNCTTDMWNSTFTNYTVDCSRSYNKTTVPNLLCEKRGNSCDGLTATCEESNGFLTCQCTDKLLYKKATEDATKCLKIPCLSNSDCNNPFGTCIEDDNDSLMSYCDCMWGFEGASCMEPWGFVFTVLTGALGVILIIVLTICICNTRKSKSAKEEKPEDMNLKNPFVDFQPGLVRAKVPSNMYSVSDTYDMTTRESSGRNNGAYDHAHDDSYGKQTSTFQHEYQSVDNRKSGASADYF